MWPGIGCSAAINRLISTQQSREHSKRPQWSSADQMWASNQLTTRPSIRLDSRQNKPITKLLARKRRSGSNTYNMLATPPTQHNKPLDSLKSVSSNNGNRKPARLCSSAHEDTFHTLWRANLFLFFIARLSGHLPCLHYIHSATASRSVGGWLLRLSSLNKAIALIDAETCIAMIHLLITTTLKLLYMSKVHGAVPYSSLTCSCTPRMSSTVTCCAASVGWSTRYIYSDTNIQCLMKR